MNGILSIVFILLAFVFSYFDKFSITFSFFILSIVAFLINKNDIKQKKKKDLEQKRENALEKIEKAKRMELSELKSVEGKYLYHFIDIHEEGFEDFGIVYLSNKRSIEPIELLCNNYMLLNLAQRHKGLIKFYIIDNFLIDIELLPYDYDYSYV